MTISAENPTKEEGIWILGYGSLIYKPPPHYTQRIPVTIHGYMRRFWQSSIDHRGTPEKPGRVVTLIPYEEILSIPEFLEDLQLYSHDFESIKCPHDLTTFGVVYYIPPEHANEVKEYLDIREQNGYTLHEVEVHLNTNDEHELLLKDSLELLPVHERTGKRVLKTSVYIGTVSNEAFVGPEKIEDTAKVIATSHGPSGPNVEYLKLLHQSIEEMLWDEHDAVPDLYLLKLLHHVDKMLQS
ncbi:gamma-glutamylcyclotransferase NDAI_0C06070 [Naumovozyma dairenensis CBS 421]|uniref:glutathione-specific gamma-glutamylcyclotransferase n=1 Tax=Naumovozyma dairenensis (strain ATCC 10597 / BCRC 20456 / CBS 421 / NBRC 0211 / NRRL Y-12639) TaxID=1071378 RepID=G0W905_NAUDC|nr:hypothetical protein NDAI_0C06070 [Naumovozyma dairenensis CBS 421]CCD24266.1 hypothetical protein NDAI_0C06070 [Naumovozyma dairenensis CBS 421]